MGTILNLEAAEARPLGDGASMATLIDKESTEMHVALLRLAAGHYQGEVPLGSDRYLFVIEGIDKRYRASNRKEEQQILEQFTRVYPPKARHSLAQLRDGYGAK